MVLPTFTTNSPGPTYTASHLAFAAAMSLLGWVLGVFVQTVRHRDYFLPALNADHADSHAAPPSDRQAWGSGALLLVALVSVVGLAKVLSPRIESVLAAGAPPAVLGIAIAMVVLLPETVAALRAAHGNLLQTSLNLSYNSALASFG